MHSTRAAVLRAKHESSEAKMVIVTPFLHAGLSALVLGFVSVWADRFRGKCLTPVMLDPHPGQCYLGGCHRQAVSVENPHAPTRTHMHPHVVNPSPSHSSRPCLRPWNRNPSYISM